jgi:hypothetical protein
MVLVILTGCGRPADLEGPAPAWVLACSLAYAVDAGYQLVDGGADEGFVRVIQRVAPQPEDARPTRPQPTLSDVANLEPAEIVAENELLIEVDGGRTHFMVLGNVEPETSALSGSSAIEQARTMLAMCTTSPPVFPGGGDPQTIPPPPGAPL